MSLSDLPRSSLSSPSVTSQAQSSLTIAVVGDVHDLWDAEDATALEHLGVDLVLLVGDFGNESVEVVRSVAELPLPKAVILGNHDAWYTATDWGRKLRPHPEVDQVQQQLDLLGAAHVGYSKLDFPDLQLTVVGGRPFSWGGSEWKNQRFYQERFSVNSFDESTARIAAAAASAAYETVLFIGHCGPTGLGDQPEAPCGRDWKPLGGDFGDPDLAAAIEQTRSIGKTVPLVAFGHMHHQLRHTKERLRTAVATDASGTVYLNAARVPRRVETDAGHKRNFSLVQLEAGVVTQISLVWVDSEFCLCSEQVLYRSPHPVAQLASRE